MKALCVYCGSSSGSDPRYVLAAEETGRHLAEIGTRGSWQARTIEQRQRVMPIGLAVLRNSDEQPVLLLANPLRLGVELDGPQADFGGKPDL